MPLSTTKHSALRNNLASQLKELRSWPPLNSQAVPNPLRRPVVEDVITTMLSPVPLAEILEQATLAMEHLQETALLEMGEAEEEFTTVMAAPTTGLLHGLLIRAGTAHDAEFAEAEECVYLYRKVRATDTAYATYLAPIWKKYQQQSMVSDDTSAQYHEFLRLKQIYEPQVNADGTVSC